MMLLCASLLLGTIAVVLTTPAHGAPAKNSKPVPLPSRAFGKEVLPETRRVEENYLSRLAGTLSQTRSNLAALIRDIASDVTTDIFGNFIPAKTNGLVEERSRFYVREGRQWRIEEAKKFTVALDPLRIEVSQATAGIIARTTPTELVLALPHGNLTLAGLPPVKVMQGRFECDRWVSEGAFPIQRQERTTVLQVDTPKVILLGY